nr:hypothetical protein [Bacteroidota bacterium]
MPYRGIDIGGKEIDFQMDLMIIRKFKKYTKDTIYFNDVNVKDALLKINQRINTNKTEHEILLDSIKINYAPKEAALENDPSNDLKNTELITHELQFYSVFNEDFEKQYPLIPNLKFSTVKIPQLEGIETEQKFYPVCFSTSYNKFGMGDENKTKVYVQKRKDPYSYIPIVEADIDSIIKKQKEISDSIKNIFSDNYKNAGSLINPDIVIDNISILKQGISLTDEINNRVSDISNIRPADILRGMNVEILGGIDLKKILRNVIPIADSPIFNIIEEANGGFTKYGQEYESIKKQVENLPNEIRALESSLKNTANSKLKTYVEKYYEASEKLKKLYYQTDSQIQINSKQIYIYEIIREKEFAFQTELISKLTGTALTLSDEIKKYFNDVEDSINITIYLKQISDAIQKQISVKNEERLKNIASEIYDVSVINELSQLSELKNAYNAIVNSKPLYATAISTLLSNLQTVFGSTT